MLVIVFRSRLSDNVEGYEAMAEEMLETARAMPGYVDFKSYSAEDGERVSIAWWENEESLEPWREHMRHRLAQQYGRERWYDFYDVQVAEVIRSRRFERKANEPEP